jgi:hypothetical protein
VIRANAAFGLPIPNWYGELLKFYWNKVRDSLDPEPKNLSFWVNSAGNPMGKLSSKCFFVYMIAIAIILAFD